MAGAPLILADPLPRTLDAICDAATRTRLAALGRLEVFEQAPAPDDAIDRLLPETVLLIGQTAMPRVRLDRAPKLRAIFNVETNFLPNIDYAACQERGIWVLSPTAAFAPAVAESALAMAIDLARGITAADRAFRAGTERFGLAGNDGCFLFAGAPVGLIGFGDLGRALRALLVPFGNPVTVYDPWLPPELIAQHDCRPAPLDAVLATSRILFIFAAPTIENAHFIGARELARVPDGAAVLLMSRAGVVDFPAFCAEVRSGRLRGATDVFPDEPVAKDDPVRAIEGMLLSAHRTGGMPEALFNIGRMTVADAELILRGLSPVMCRRADPALAARLRSKPISLT